MARREADTERQGPPGLADLFEAGALGDRLEPDDRAALASVEARLFGKSPRPLTLSRYVLRQRLGAGGAGIVYEAYDPELDRKVAIKLLNPQRTQRAEMAEARVRLVREARAMARLSHPNVIAVYDVGTYDEDDLSPQAVEPLGRANDEGVFLVMELVEGQTLQSWLETRRDWREVLEKFVAAGRGLAAAHEAGLIHRDFKLANVLVGNDGRVRVLDFGLARPQWIGHPSGGDGAIVAEIPTESLAMDETVDVHRPSKLPAPDEASISPTAMSSQLTMAGTVLGTPSYMAPEQHRADPSDARTDQYSFCVALYMGLYGGRPFDAESFAELGEAKRAGKFRVPGPEVGVPKSLFSIVARGLSPDPEDRYPSMHALLAQLSRDPLATRKRGIVAGLALGGILATGGGVVAWQAYDRTACDGYEDHVRAVWGDAQRRQMQASFAATGQAFAAATFESAAQLLDDFEASWVEQRVLACEIGRDAGREPREITDRRVACLDSRLRELGATTEVLLDEDPSVAEYGVNVAAALDSPATCGDLEQLVSGVDESDGAGRAEVEAMIARARALKMAHHDARALEVAEQSVEAARRLRLERLEVKALLELARVGANQNAEDVASTLRDALTKAERLGDDETSLKIMIELIRVLGWRLSKPDEAEWFVGLSRARLERHPLSGLYTSRLASHVSVLRYAQGRFEEALELSLEALEGAEVVFGPEHPRMSGLQHSVGNRLRGVQRYEDARLRYQRALEIDERHLGPHHPALAGELEGLASVETDLGNFAAAQAYLERSLVIQMGAYGKETTRTGFTHLGLGELFREQERYAEGLEHYELALDRLQRSLGPTHLTTVETHMGIGLCRIGLGQLEEARAGLEEGLLAAERGAGPKHPSAAEMAGILADALSRAGDLELAAEYAARAVRDQEASRGSEHAAMAHPLIVMGRIQLARGEREPAVASVRRALGLLDAGPSSRVLIEQANLILREAGAEPVVEVRGEMTSDVELLEAWRAGDDTAGNHLVRRYFARVHHFFKSKVLAAAEDLTQQTFLACVEARDRVDSERGFRPYLFGIARAKLLHHYRRVRRHDDRLDPLETSIAGLEGSVSGLVAAREEQRVLLVALRKLPLDYQIALEMFYWEDMKVAEVAAVLGAPEGTVKARLARARGMLRGHLEALVADPDARDTTVRNLDRWARSLRVQEENPELEG